MELQIIGSRDIKKEHVEQFPSWFLNKGFELRGQVAAKMIEESFVLEIERMSTSILYTSCVVNGVKFVSATRDANRKTQNSGVFVVG